MARPAPAITNAHSPVFYPLLALNLFRPAFPRQFMERFHQLYIDTVSNPFVDIGAKITSERFRAELSRLLKQR